MAKILYIDHYAGSVVHGMEFRPYYMAREWIKMGHQVSIVAASHSHLRLRNPAVSNELTVERVAGVDFVWLRTPPYSGNGYDRVWNIISFVRALYRHFRHLVAVYSPDVVIASSTYPFDIFPARSLARLANAKLIFELHDLWPLSPMELGGMSRWHPFIMAAHFAEGFMCKTVDALVSMLPKADQHLIARGLPPEKKENTNAMRGHSQRRVIIRRPVVRLPRFCKTPRQALCRWRTHR